MPGHNLRRAEAEERAAVVRVHEVAIELDLTRGAEVFGSATTIRFDGVPGARTFVEVLPHSLERVTLNGGALHLTAPPADGRIALPGLQGENELVVEATMRYSHSGEGLHRFTDPADGEAYVYSEMAVPNAPRVFAVFDQPDLKASYRLTVTAPEGWLVVGNQPASEPEHLGSGAVRWRFDPTPRLSSYLVAIMAGPYVVQRSELTSSDGRRIPLGVLCRVSLARFVDADDLFDVTRAGFAFYEAAFGVPFPFEKYDQLFVPEYNWGAMENPGAVTFNEAFVFRSKVTDAERETRAMVVLHELAHMWFGDLVTMRWWDDLWLNESFATFMSFLATAEATAWTDAWATFVVTQKNRAYRDDQLPSTHPIVADIGDIEDVEVNFDGITYSKGASVLKQLVAYVGREAFFAGLRSYLLRSAWGNATLADLLAELAAARGRDLSLWSRAFLQTAGPNTLELELEDDGAGRIVRAAVVQSAPAEHPTLRPHRLAVGCYEPGADGALRRTARLEVEVTGERTEVPGLAGRARPALLLVNDDDLAYAKVRLDDASERTALAAVSHLEPALPRALVWGALWNATRDAELPARGFLAAVLAHVGHERSSPILRSVLAQAVEAGEQLVAPEHREAALGRLADGMQRLALAAEAGSDAQLQLVTTLARTARTGDQLDLLDGLLSGARTLPGLEIDADLRWRLLDGLVAGGRAGEEEIAAALAADRTARGQESAAAARAAIPTAAAKEAAWRSVTASDALPNEQVRATCAGFLRVRDPGLLEPFVGRYVQEIDALWRSRAFAIGEAVARGLYPRPVVTETLRDAVRGWLDTHPGAPSGLRRIVLEQLADTERALAGRARDAA